ncbi:hypothetical protein PMAC_000882 [Pneumocystis sp. 'macacae']|nr:hypothetical protein PMAC_000882 [Pneumocystis sp. 'macacae']
MNKNKVESRRGSTGGSEVEVGVHTVARVGWGREEVGKEVCDRDRVGKEGGVEVGVQSRGGCARCTDKVRWVVVEIRSGGVKNKNNRTEEIEVELD